MKIFKVIVGKIKKLTRLELALSLVTLLLVIAFGIIIIRHFTSGSFQASAGNLDWQNVGTATGSTHNINFSACSVENNSNSWTIKGLAAITPPLSGSDNLSAYPWIMSDYASLDDSQLISQATSHVWFGGAASQLQVNINPNDSNIIDFTSPGESPSFQLSASQIQSCTSSKTSPTPPTTHSVTPSINTSDVTVPSEPCSSFTFSSATNGTTDNTSNLQNFVNQAVAAQKTGQSVCVTPDLNLVISSTINVPGPAILFLNGATIRKANGMNGDAFNITSPGVSVLNLTINGNSAGRAQGGGITTSASETQLNNIHVSGVQNDGIKVTGAGSTLAIQKSSSNNNGTASTWGFGFFAAKGTKLITDNTTAVDNSRDGYFLTGADNSSISGDSANNINAGVEVEATNNFSMPSFNSTDDWHYGVYIGGDSSACSIGNLTLSNTGIAQSGRPNNSYGAGIEFFGATGCQSNSITDTITYSGTSGYGVAVAKQGSGTGFNTQGSSNNTFENVSVTHTGNPAIDITGGSSNNTFVNAYTTDSSVGVNIGEGTVNNNSNTFDSLTLDKDWDGGIGIEGSSGNVFNTVNDIDSGSGYPNGKNYTGDAGSAVVRIMSPTTDKNPPNSTKSNVIQASDNNVIHQLNATANETINHTPLYLVYADPAATGNRATLGAVQLSNGARAYKGTQWYDDLNGGNHFNE